MSDAVDWSLLPESQTQFIPYFEKYGSIQYDVAIYTKFDCMSPGETKEAKWLMDALDLDFLSDWIDAHPITENRCSALVCFTIHFLSLGRDGGVF